MCVLVLWKCRVFFSFQPAVVALIPFYHFFVVDVVELTVSSLFISFSAYVLSFVSSTYLLMWAAAANDGNNTNRHALLPKGRRFNCKE